MDNPARAAAEQIAALINSRVQSPRIDEMEAIIAGVNTPQPACAHVDPLGPVSPELAAAFFDWDQARIRDSEELDDHEARARQDIIAEKTAALFAIGVRSFADLRLLVPAVAYWNSPGSVKSPDYPECVLELGGEDEGEGFEPKSVAYLVRAVIGLLGMGGVASSIPAHARQDDPTLAALEQKLAQVDQLYEVARGPAEEKGSLPLRDMADAADNDLTALSRRIFAARPITLHNLKQRAVLAKYWHQHRPDGEEWKTPSDCDAWEDQVIAHLIHAVLQIDAPSEQSPDLALFQSALLGLRVYPEPRAKSPEYEVWYAEQGQRLEGLNRIAERILGSEAPPLDALAAIAREYVLLSGHPRADQIADAEAHDSIPEWVVARLVHALLPDTKQKVGE